MLHDVGLDSNGNTYVTGYIDTPARFGTTNVSGSAQANLFLAKYDPQGALLWVRSSETVSTSQPPGAMQACNCVVVDSAGNAFIAGRFTANMKLGGTTYTAGTDGNLFVTKFSPAGSVLWTKTFGSTFVEQYYRIALDGSGALMLAYQNSATGLTIRRLQASNGTDTSFAGLASSGGIRPFGLAVADNGAVFCAGDFAGLLSSGERSTDAVADVFLVKWDSLGNREWVRTGGGTDEDYTSCLRVNRVGEPYLCGLFFGSVQFNGQALTSAGQRDSFVVKYSQSGDLLWATSVGGELFDHINSACLTASSDVLCVGTFSGAANFGDLTLMAGEPSAFTVHLAAIPRLHMSRHGAVANVSWESASTNFVLQGAGLVGSSVVWERLETPIVAVGKSNSAVLPLGGAGRLLRLSRPLP